MFIDPTIITKGPNATTTAQKAVTILLPCQVSHDPTVNVTWDWRKNTGRLYDRRYTVLIDGTLQIVSTQEADAATFSCNVYSNGGNASVSTVVQIVCKLAHFLWILSSSIIFLIDLPGFAINLAEISLLNFKSLL